jgi:general secretion pathway protein A
MYESFYGLQRSPFQLSPDPSFYFDSRQHARARAFLEYGMHQKEGFIVVTGEVGAGKTTILRTLIDTLDPAKVISANLVSTQLDAEDTLRLVAASFGVRIKEIQKSDLLLALEAHLVKATASGKRCLLIVDEAQNLTQRAVEELRMLSNFQLGGQGIMQSFLVGQPEFRNILQSPSMEQLRQRVIASCHIGPLDFDETQPYIEHRLRCAGLSKPLKIAPACFSSIYKFSGGIPRRINTLCDRLLLSGFLGEKKEFLVGDVDEIVQEVRNELTGGPAPSSFAEPAPPLVAPRVERRSPPKKKPVPVLEGRSADRSPGDEIDQLLTQLHAGDLVDRLSRLESGMLRIERANASSLKLLQQLVDAVRAGTRGGDDRG